MSDKIDWKSHSFDRKAGYLGFPLLIVSSLVAFASTTFVVRTIWAWYPPFGIAAPSFMGVAALLTLIGFTRTQTFESSEWSNERWFHQVMVRPLLPWVTLGLFVALRGLAT